MDLNGIKELLVPIVVANGVRVLGALLGLWVAFRVAKVVQARVTLGLQSRDFDLALSLFFGNFARWVILSVSLLAILGVFGVETASFAAVIGAAGLAAGLAFQGTLSNFSAGVMLLVFRPFKIGDIILVSGIRGRVAEIGLFSTSMDTTDRRREILPNSIVNTGIIENHSFHEIRRVDIVVYFGPDCRPEAIRSLLTDVGAAHEHPGGKRSPDIVCKRIHPFGSEWELRIFAPMREHNDVLYAAQEAVLTGMVNQGLAPPGAMSTLPSEHTR